MLGIGQQVHQHLLQLVPVGEGARQVGVELQLDSDPLDPERVLQERAHRTGDLVERNHAALGLLIAHEQQQVADDLLATLGFGNQGIDPAGQLGVECRRGSDQLGVAEDRRERVVQLVHDAGDHLSQARHLLGLVELLLDAAAFGHVGQHHDQPLLGPRRVSEGRQGHRPVRPVLGASRGLAYRFAVIEHPAGQRPQVERADPLQGATGRLAAEAGQEFGGGAVRLHDA